MNTPHQPEITETDNATPETTIVHALGRRTGMKHLIDMHPRMSHGEWLRLLGRIWHDRWDISENLPQLMQIMGTEGPLNEMMTDQEQALYADLPDNLVVYRGGFTSNLRGASWTQNSLVASVFPLERKCGMHPEDDKPLLAAGTVTKKNILALKHFGFFSELITFSAHIWTIDELQVNQQEGEEKLTISKVRLADYTPTALVGGAQ
jgi:hypothetical protein